MCVRSKNWDKTKWADDEQDRAAAAAALEADAAAAEALEAADAAAAPATETLDSADATDALAEELGAAMDEPEAELDGLSALDTGAAWPAPGGEE